MRFSIGVFVLAIVCSTATAQTSLTAYTDAKGFLDVQRLTCAQLEHFKKTPICSRLGIAAGTMASQKNTYSIQLEQRALSTR